MKPVSWHELRGLIVALVICACSLRPIDAHAQASAEEAAVERVKRASRAEFDAVLAEYDASIEARPYDAVIAVARCRFIDLVASSFEEVEWIEGVYDAQEDCIERARKRFAEHPEVLLYDLERTYGEERLKLGYRLQGFLGDTNWTASQIARLHTQLAKALDAMERATAKDHALIALRFDKTADVRLIAAKWLHASGDNSAAIEILSSVFDTAGKSGDWAETGRLTLLAKLGARDVALKFYGKLKAAQGYDHLSAAEALLALHLTDSARTELKQAAANTWQQGRALRALLMLEMQQGTSQRALATYNQLRDLGFMQDPLAVGRVSLFMHDMTLRWRARDLLGVLAMLAVMGVIAIVTLIPLALIHYRGLVRQLANVHRGEESGWRLRHAWLVLTAFFCAGSAGLYFAGPSETFPSIAAEAGFTEPTADQFASITLAGGILSSLLLAALMTRWRQFLPRWSVQWSVLKSVTIGLALALVFRSLFLLSLLAKSGVATAASNSSFVARVLISIEHEFGAAAAIWLAAVMAPVVEEFMFRGVLLSAFSRYLSFAAANTIQAAIFATIHWELSALPILFVFGLTAGALVRRSGGLLASIVLHSAFNLILVLVQIWR